MNIADAVHAHAKARPDQTAIEDGKRAITYAEFAVMVDRAATKLRERGIEAGDIIVVALPDTAEHIAVLFGLAKIGAISYSLDENLPDIEQSKSLRGLKPKAAILRDAGRRFVDLVPIPLGAFFETASGAAPPAPATEPEAFDGGAPLMVIQSSGTTGAPKRLLLSHDQIVGRNSRLIATLQLGPSDRFLQVLHLRFFLGREGAIVTITVGGTIVLYHGGGAEDYLRYFSERRITYVTLTPFHLRSVLSCVRSETPLWPTLRIQWSSAPLSPDERSQARRRLTPNLYETYGTNEAGDFTLTTPRDFELYPDSNGPLIEAIEAQIVDEHGAVLAFGQTGLIRLRGPYFPTEYLGDPEATARYFKDGWFYPGDLASLNQQGYVFLKGRADDVINNSGAKFFPAEVEAVLIRHPSTADVAVVGGPHALFGEVAVAYAVRTSPLTAKELHAFCKGKIAMYKAPQWIFFVDELPRVATGKPDKKKLKATFVRYMETRDRRGE